MGSHFSLVLTVIENRVCLFFCKKRNYTDQSSILCMHNQSISIILCSTFWHWNFAKMSTIQFLQIRITIKWQIKWLKSHIDCYGSPKKCNNPFILSQLNEKLVSVGKKKWNNWLKTTAIYKIIENRFYWERDFIDIILDALHRAYYPHKIYSENEIIQNSSLNEDNYGDDISHYPNETL